MNSAMDLGVLVRFLLRTLGIFLIIFVLALVTPKIAALIDKWAKKYREHHNPKKDPTYGIRSIYELPPREDAEPEEDPDDDEDEPADAPYDPADAIPVASDEGWSRPVQPLPEAEPAPAAETEVPWFMR